MAISKLTRPTFRLSIDVGGTFTDVCLLDEETSELRTAKVPSSSSDPLASVLAAIAELDLDLADVRLVTHSTTLTTNALITREFPPAAMITTQGFRDVIEMRDGTQEDVWDSFREVGKPYIARRDRYEISERTDYSGRILTPLDIEQANQLASTLKIRGIKTVAICFMNSYANSAHERAMREALIAVDPTMTISISGEVLPEINEYERFSTTVANALLASLVSNYISRLDTALSHLGYRGDLLLMHSGGGSMTAGLAQILPLRLAASSIAGGAMAAKHIAHQCGFQDAIALDMGGTSTDITLILNGQVRVVQKWSVEYGHPISFPGIEFATIGSGGGTIAWVDAAGALRSGPQSAGAVPGPASYDRGGLRATNTDANLYLGRLGRVLAGGQVELSLECAQLAISADVSEKLGLSELSASLAIVQIADAATASAVRLLRNARRSLSPSAPLIAFGGAGPMHAVAVAKELNIPLVIIPPHPGITSALGCLLVDIRHDFSSMFQCIANVIEPGALEAQFSSLEREARDRLSREGIPPNHMILEREISMRYAGQWRSLTIPIGKEQDCIADAISRFQEDYQAQYTYMNTAVPVEVYQLSLTAIGILPKVQFRNHEVIGGVPVGKAHRHIAFDETAHFILTDIYSRSSLVSGMTVSGPAVIEQLDATVLIPPGYEAFVDEWLNLRISEVN
ncbi:MAG: hydantoinase [Actinobacteria bacterium]|nr:MAG: hydantoinase [Actinomycetota bacterium]